MGSGVMCCPSLAFKHDTWKTGCMPDSGGNSSLYATIPIFYNTLKGPKNLGASLPT